ncbi:MAG: tol-pal system protein YbgF [Pseudohongiellaceae bacterium]
MKKAWIAVASKLVTFSILGNISLSASAQCVGSIIESQGVTLSGQDQAVGSNANSDALSLLLEQNQQLRSELQALRAIIEEQGFEVRKLQRDSLTRYTSTDDRLSALEQGASPITLSGGAVSSATDTAESIASAADSSMTNSRLVDSNENVRADGPNSLKSPAVSGRRTLQPAVLSEQQLYQMAYDSVINSNFERSIAEFDQYMSVYPAGRFVTNAHYWKGQAYLYLDRYAEAKDSYEIILNRYEDSAKLADAMYGLGLSYQGLGNITQAKQLLNEIKRRFPNTGVANLADTKLLQLD